MGALLALDIIKNVNVELNLFDSQNNKQTVYNLIEQNKIPTENILVGPLYSKNVKLILDTLKSPLTLISPLSSLKVNNLKEHINLVKAKVDKDYMAERMIRTILEEYTDQRIFIFGGFFDNKIINKIKTALLKNRDSIDIDIIFSMDDHFDNEQVDSLIDSCKRYDLETRGIEDRENWFIISTNNSIIINDVIVNLIQKKEINKKVFSIFPNDDFFSKLDKDNLKILNFSYPTANYIDYKSKHTKYFIKEFVNKFYKLPNKYAILGFDLFYYIINNNISSNNIDKIRKIKMVGIGNKFDFVNTKNNIFENKGVFLIRYNISGVNVE